MVSIVLALISGVVQTLCLYIKRRFDLKEIEAGRKKVINGKLVDNTETDSTPTLPDNSDK